MYETPKIPYGEMAAQVTVTLPDGSSHQQWFCTKCRRIWGTNDQHMASWCCCTHRVCDCGKEYEKHWTMCDDCRAKKSRDRWYAMPEVPWDGAWPLYDDSSDKYFWDESDLLDFIDEREHDDLSIEYLVESLRLSSCHQNKPRTFDINEWCCDDLPDDGEISDADSIDERVNAIISEAGVLSFGTNADRLNVRQVLHDIGYVEGNANEG